MKQWFSYKNLQLPKSTGLGKWKPHEVLRESFDDLDYCIGIGEGQSATDRRIVGCTTVADTAEADQVIAMLGAFGAQKLTVSEAHDLLEALSGWAVTVNGDNLEATVNGQSYTW